MINTNDETLMKIAKKCVSLNLDLRYDRTEFGPIVTTYFFKCHSVLAKIQSRSEDIALAIGSESVLIERQGELVAIAIPNKERKIIDFKEFLHWLIATETTHVLNIPLGITPTGGKRSFDLIDAPHLLIAGATGSGKSVYESAIITALVAQYSSSMLELYLVDTKRTDLTLFRRLPHVKIIAEELGAFFKVINKLRSICYQRLDILSHSEKRNIREYNQAFPDKPMYFIVLLIDELANLMDLDSQNRKSMDREERATTLSVGEVLKELTQISRAAGIHVIASTQRSSVKVISGDIKVNFPTRISFKMPSSMDSRVILDENGAENLLGKGDMLAKLPEHDQIQRFHAPFVRLDDIHFIIENLEYVKGML